MHTPSVSERSTVGETMVASMDNVQVMIMKVLAVRAVAIGGASRYTLNVNGSPGLLCPSRRMSQDTCSFRVPASIPWVPENSLRLSFATATQYRAVVP